MTEHHERFTVLDMIGTVAAGLAIVTSLVMLLMVPTFTRMFEDFGAALPLPTLLVIQRWPILLFALLSSGLLLVGSLGLGVSSLQPRRWIVLGAFVLASLTVVTSIAALYLPVFQMASMIESPAPDLMVELPRSATAMEVDDSIHISIAGDGVLFLGADRIDLAALRQRLLAVAEDNPRSRVVIAADTDTRHGDVVEIIDLAKECGLSELGIVTSTPESEPEPLP